MCISVDLPEPDGPITATQLAPRHLERDAAQGVHGRGALAVVALEVARAHRDAVARRLSYLSRLGWFRPHEFVYSKALGGVKCA